MSDRAALLVAEGGETKSSSIVMDEYPERMGRARRGLTRERVELRERADPFAATFGIGRGSGRDGDTDQNSMITMNLPGLKAGVSGTRVVLS